MMCAAVQWQEQKFEVVGAYAAYLVVDSTTHEVRSADLRERRQRAQRSPKENLSTLRMAHTLEGRNDKAAAKHTQWQGSGNRGYERATRGRGDCEVEGSRGTEV